ncbi:DUF5372 family protein [Actinacidiphila oryziradicis]|uniref:Uncharacterized protein n=1 Tax=Actinacidiphila oryziradicis TaxID=2571141 RepID=A0A4U0RVP5_9ACTN|nr:DUF5372 family protein [Actinacidiphila oryziradicis]TKA00280.1 hypothetical protein FCI23_43240 [Actinacidiphila oryziradicis]
MKVTHRFHPWFGLEFVFVDRRLAWDEDRVSFVGEDGAVASLPAAWTDIPAGSGVLDDAQRARITALAGDFPSLWNDPATPVRERKRLLRLLVTDVTMIRTEQITAHVRLRGGQEHTLVMPVPLASWQIRQTPAEVVNTIDRLLDDHTDAQIAEILTAQGQVSGMNQSIHVGIVKHIRRAYHLRSHPQRLTELGMVSLNEIARRLALHPNTIKKWRDAGLLTGRLANDKGEYLYHLPGPDLVRPRIGRPPACGPSHDSAEASRCRSPASSGATETAPTKAEEQQ